jgi:hypothetical protein
LQIDISQWLEKAGLNNLRLPIRESGGEGLLKTVAGSLTGVVVLAVLLVLVLGWWWSLEPGVFDVREVATERAEEASQQLVVGYVTASTLIEVAETLLDKNGGYLTNDILPPGVILDNIPSWEFGVLVQIRDLARALRNDMSRSQSQSVEDPDLAIVEPQFNFDSDSWLFPATESEYRTAIDALYAYVRRLTDPQQQDAQFFARADNLREWVSLVEKRLGGYSQQLSASVGQVRINTDLAGDADAEQATTRPSQLEVRTPWLEIDDRFYEARGAAWALVHFLHAAEIDFRGVLEKKNALVSLRQIIRELEATQDVVWSPIILNGSGFGIVANHSLVMASYISRANAALIDLRNLLEQG